MWCWYRPNSNSCPADEQPRSIISYGFHAAPQLLQLLRFLATAHTQNMDGVDDYRQRCRFSLPASCPLLLLWLLKLPFVLHLVCIRGAAATMVRLECPAWRLALAYPLDGLA